MIRAVASHRTAWLLVLCCACSPEPAEPPVAAPGAAASGAAATVADAHSSRDALDWAGRYAGVIPCADCPGIRTTVTLRADGRFERTLTYLERSAAPHADTGAFSWNAAGSVVTLEAPEGGQPYRVAENALIQLDREGNPITGALAARYVLHKHQGDPAIEGRTWTLTELRGQPVDGAARTPFLVLDPERGVASGNASCNVFSGPYAIPGPNRIGFGEPLAPTRMFCPGPNIESEFLDALRAADGYVAAAGTLTLVRARMAPLARFAVTAE